MQNTRDVSSWEEVGLWPHILLKWLVLERDGSFLEAKCKFCTYNSIEFEPHYWKQQLFEGFVRIFNGGISLEDTTRVEQYLDPTSPVMIINKPKTQCPDT